MCAQEDFRSAEVTYRVVDVNTSLWWLQEQRVDLWYV